MGGYLKLAVAAMGRARVAMGRSCCRGGEISRNCRAGWIKYLHLPSGRGDPKFFARAPAPMDGVGLQLQYDRLLRGAAGVRFRISDFIPYRTHKKSMCIRFRP